MLALRIETFGPPDGLQLKDIPQPAAGTDDVLIAIHAAAVNPSDIGNVAGKFPATTLPRTPGRDYAGTVKDGPRELLGLEVWGTGGRELGITRDGSHAQFIAVPASTVRLKPAVLSMEQAAAVGVPYCVAWLALVDCARIGAHETVLVTGAAGAVGRAATQIAHWNGARVIGADRRIPPDLQADHVIDTSTQDLSESVRGLTNGKGADAALDTVGGSLFEPTLKSLAYRGRQVAIASPGQRRVTFDLIDFYHQGLDLMGVDTFKLDLNTAADLLDALRPGFDSGALSAPKTKSFPLQQSIDAYRAVEQGSHEKIVLIP